MRLWSGYLLGQRSALFPGSRPLSSSTLADCVRRSPDSNLQTRDDPIQGRRLQGKHVYGLLQIPHTCIASLWGYGKTSRPPSAVGLQICGQQLDSTTIRQATRFLARSLLGCCLGTGTDLETATIADLVGSGRVRDLPCSQNLSLKARMATPSLRSAARSNQNGKQSSIRVTDC